MKGTGLKNLPLQGFDQNRIWLVLVALAVEVTAWMQMLALTDDPASRWEPKRQLPRSACASPVINEVHLRLSAHAPWIELLITALVRRYAIPRIHLTSTNPTTEKKVNQLSGPWAPTTTRPRRASARRRAPNRRPKYPPPN